MDQESRSALIINVLGTVEGEGHRSSGLNLTLTAAAVELVKRNAARASERAVGGPELGQIWTVTEEKEDSLGKARWAQIWLVAYT